MVKPNKRTEGKIPAHYGMKDYYKFYTTNSLNPVDKHKYNKVISEFNKAVVNLIVEENLDFNIPYLGLVLCIRKTKRSVRIENGKLINSNPVDWKSTREMWSNDPETKEKKLIVRYVNTHTSKYVFRIKIIKKFKNYNNKKYYRFQACREFQRNLKTRIFDDKKDKFDAYQLYK